MASLNRVMIIGNVGSEPEMRFTPSGKPVTTFRVATNQVFKSPEGEKKEETEWFTVVAWNQLAEQCNRFINKGSLIYAEGRLRTRSWEGQDGQKHYRTEVIANRVSFLDKKGTTSIAEGEKTEEAEKGDVEPEDIPF